MNDIVKVAIIALATTVAVFFGASLLVGDNQSEVLGGFTRFPNSDLEAKSLTATAGDIIADAGDLSLTSTGTTTIGAATTGSGKGTCIEMVSTTGTTTRIYLAATTTALRIEAGSCQ